MDQDETPTPKQSGSFAVMQGVCEDSLRSLEAWRARARDDVRAAEIQRFDERFRVLLEAVKSWAVAPPSPTDKACTIEDIIGARNEATDWGARWGWSL
jgi:hypothetical protein